MKQLSLISDPYNRSVDMLCRWLGGNFAVRVLSSDDVARTDPDPFVFVNIDANKLIRANNLKRWLWRRPKHGAAVFAVDRGSWLQAVRAYSIGATDILVRPFTGLELLAALLRDNKFRRSDPEDHQGGVSKCVTALQDLFVSASEGMPLDTRAIADAGRSMIEHIEKYGFAEWVRAVHDHHGPTYQHCLLVAGAAAAFAKQLEFNRTDLNRVAVAGLLHDVGKAKIPVAILEKPMVLDAAEMAEVQRHVMLGYEALRATPDLHPEMLDVVLHHHEFLDGSGYPQGLQGNEISDLTRIVTITDIFGALIERRAYRGPLSGEEAYQILVDMGGKLDRDLVRAFKQLSRVRLV